MDCNREEALRAKDIAEKKMKNKDFTGARKLVRKAQQLFPDLENITQMLIVCDVHCSAEQKLSGNEMDWYGILQIEQTANEATIKKQYRKFALQLHPDKNKSVGAEAAFKLIGEAQTVLLDSGKRAMHDMKRKTSMSYRPPHNFHVNLNAGVQNNVRTNFTNLNPQQGLNGGSPTFWTVCPFCSVRYQYYREVLNRSLRCQSCNRPFIAYEMNVQGTSSATYSSQQAFGQSKDGLNYGPFKVGVGSQGNSHAGNINIKPFEKKGPTSRVSRKLNGKRRRKRAVEISESSDSIGSSSTDSENDRVADEDDVTSGQNHSTYREENPRRSTRQKQQVSYKENLSDDDDNIVWPSKRAKGSKSPCVAEEDNGKAANNNVENGLAADLKDNKKEVKQRHSLYPKKSLLNRSEETKEVWGKEVESSKMTAEVSEHCTPDISSNATDHPNVYVFPDAEFSDFDKDKKEDRFAAGQIWAVYDTKDGMPRFYALIRKVFSSGFKLRIIWFDPAPTDKDEINWVNKQLPVACGKFRLGESEITEDHPMFSHRILCKRIDRDTFNVYPRKGETWALYKNWDIRWYTDVGAHQKYEYEFVEILSDYVEGEGVFIAYLAKLKGFVSLFSRVMKEGTHSIQIPSVELFRFSHRVPSFEMTGQERVGVPIGSYELDPASLPLNLEETAVSDDLEVKVGHSPHGVNKRSSDRLKPMTKSDGDVYTFQANSERSNSMKNNGSFAYVEGGCSAPSASTPEAMEIPDPQFYNFDAGRSLEKFQIGQIWVFYCDEDGLPKYYGRVMKIGTSPNLELHIMWLASCWLPEKAIRWEDKDMLISCGRFKTRSGNSNVYTNTLSVSHQMHVNIDGKNNEYAIFPRKGEVWALYRNWTANIKCSDLVNWEYDIVEVLEENELWIEVLILEIVGGFNSVFKAQTNEGFAVTMSIPQAQLLRFSHQIPAFKLTEEHGNLRGYWELDPGALPIHFWNPQ